MALVFLISSIVYIFIDITLASVFFGLALLWVGESLGYYFLWIGALTSIVKSIIKIYIKKQNDIKHQLEIQETQENINFWKKYFHSEGFSLDEKKIPNHDDWMRYRTYWYIQKNLTFEKASQKAQQEYDKMWEDCRQHALSRELRKTQVTPTIKYSEPSQAINPYYDRNSPLNMYFRPQYIKGMTAYYEERGYSNDEAKEKATRDFSDDHDPMKNQN
ncbi:MAG: hypothetical protein HY869_10050 [Chloroflexi bacterium]|nr:hypothetical protein [Chloroflexota bacterium]